MGTTSTTFTITLRGPFDSVGGCLFDYEWPGIAYRMTTHSSLSEFVADVRRRGHHVVLLRSPEAPPDPALLYLRKLIEEVEPPAF